MTLADAVLSCPRGLGALVAQKFAAEGCNVAINYVSNVDRAKETALLIEKEHRVKTFIIQGVCVPLSRNFSLFLLLSQSMQDAGIQADCIKTVKDSIKALGGLDIIISNAGWTKFTDFGDLYAMTEEEWDKVSYAIQLIAPDRSYD
jgi:NAD(P)-dependent dehydrogenase (short-subunit alcohol dehydrogenase family)